MGSSSSSTEARRGRVRVGVALLGAALALAASGCAPMFLRPEPKTPVRRTAELPPPSPRAKATGSLWRDDVSANYLFADTKARFPGDLITIVVAEAASGLNDADTSSSTETEILGSLEQFFSLPQQWAGNNPEIDPSQLIKASASREWDGEGTTSRRGNLTASISAKVTAVAPNGNLWIEGEKIVSVNWENQHIVVAGWVRPEDIDAENRVLSSRLADARVDYYGVGVVGMKQRPGWGYFLLDVVWPF